MPGESTAATRALDIAEGLTNLAREVDALANAERDKSPPDEEAQAIERVREQARQSIGEAITVLVGHAGLMQLRERMR